MSVFDLFREKAEQAKDKAAEVKEKAPSVDEVTAIARDTAAEVKDRFAPAIKDLTNEVSDLAKEAESEIKLLTDQAKDVRRDGITSVFRKPEPDDIVALSRKARKKANKLERKAARL